MKWTLRFITHLVFLFLPYQLPEEHQPIGLEREQITIYEKSTNLKRTNRRVQVARAGKKGRQITEQHQDIVRTQSKILSIRGFSSSGGIQDFMGRGKSLFADD